MASRMRKHCRRLEVRLVYDNALRRTLYVACFFVGEAPLKGLGVKAYAYAE
ncbi:MAG: hypothetical protein QNJ47_27495 [Nostocaceae cyanobacterium]|nr:hypothetical protein [Nostocaceae cyanobacterium]